MKYLSCLLLLGYSCVAFSEAAYVKPLGRTEITTFEANEKIYINCNVLPYHEPTVKKEYTALQIELQELRDKLSFNSLTPDEIHDLQIDFYNKTDQLNITVNQLKALSQPEYNQQTLQVKLIWQLPKEWFVEADPNDDDSPAFDMDAKTYVQKNPWPQKPITQKNYKNVTSKLTRFDDGSEISAFLLTFLYGDSGLFTRQPDFFYSFLIAKPMSLIEVCQYLPYFKAEAEIKYDKWVFNSMYINLTRKVLLYAHPTF